MSSNLKISVNQLLKIFRGSLISIIPFIEKIEIKWRKGESYDDWDNIAIALYQNIVCSSLIGEVTSDYSIAKYEFRYTDYSEIDYLSVRCNEHSAKNLAFISFQSVSSPLDFVEVAVLDNFEKVVDYLNLNQEGLEFAFIKLTNGKKEIINEVIVII